MSARLGGEVLSEPDRRKLAEIERRLLEDDPQLGRRLSQGPCARVSARWVSSVTLSMFVFFLGVATEQGFLIFLGVTAVTFEVFWAFVLQPPPDSHLGQRR